MLCRTLSREKEVMGERDTHHNSRSIETNSAVNLSGKPGMDLSAVTCCNIYRHYAPVVFTLSHVHRVCSSHHHSNCLLYEIWRHFHGLTSYGQLNSFGAKRQKEKDLISNHRFDSISRHEDFLFFNIYICVPGMYSEYVRV